MGKERFDLVIGVLSLRPAEEREDLGLRLILLEVFIGGVQFPFCPLGNGTEEKEERDLAICRFAPGIDAPACFAVAILASAPKEEPEINTAPDIGIVQLTEICPQLQALRFQFVIFAHRKKELDLLEHLARSLIRDSAPIDAPDITFQPCGKFFRAAVFCQIAAACILRFDGVRRFAIARPDPQEKFGFPHEPPLLHSHFQLAAGKRAQFFPHEEERGVACDQLLIDLVLLAALRHELILLLA